ncbi:LysM domain-containing protein [Chryseobacterium sp. C39-AII1]|uniref:LysM peptidoglycan-binding domain-containing protein n=1 Tax=Chryseobacterium sp. C39-AII1 TaxID=3080332 RepID=UPI0032081929
MSIYVITHFVKKGETLEEIAALYDIPDVKMLFSFHHLHVPKDKNHLGKVLYEGQEIFIPNKEDIARMIAKRKERRQENVDRKFHKLRNRTFDFPCREISCSYLVTIHEKDSKNVYKQTLIVEHFNKNEDELHPLRIHQSEITCNDKLPSFSVEIMSSELNKSIFPLEIYVNKKGLVEKINQIYTLRKKWKQRKPDLQELFEGEIGGKLIEQVGYKICNSDILSDYLNSNILWALLLRGRMGNYEDGICKKYIKLLNELCIVKNVMLKNEDVNSKYYYISQEIRKKDNSNFQMNVKYKQDIEYGMLEEAEVDLHSATEIINITIKKTQI